MEATKRPLIGITTGANPDFNEPWKADDIGQRREYIDVIVAAGGVPVLLPYSSNTEVIERLADTMDGFLFAGGNDIDPVWYGESNTHSQEVDYQRDSFEIQLLERVEASGKPILGICRGMQMLNVARGGMLYQDIPAQVEGVKDHQYSDVLQDAAGISHKLEIVSGSLLGSIVGVGEIDSNSRHHQSVRHLGRNLVISARAEDGIIEGIEDISKDFVIGIQSHPESMRDDISAVWSKLFKRFIRVSAREHYIDARPAAVSEVFSDREELPIFIP